MKDRLKLRISGETVGRKELPTAFLAASRSVGGPDPLLSPDAVVVKQVFDLSPTSRAAAKGLIDSDGLESDDLVVLETENDEVLIVGAATLKSTARRRGIPVGDGLDLDALQPVDPTRSGLAAAVWRKVSVLGLREDELIQAAKGKAIELAQEWLGERVTEWVLDKPSWIGARAIVWAVESRMSREPGLYRWGRAKDGATEANAAPGPEGGRTTDAREVFEAVTDERLRRDAQAGPMLVFIHGTASSTVGSFGDLRDAGPAWDAIQRTFGDRIYALEHRTLSESPVENALALARRLPAGARLSVVTHSRGGLVGDLLCLGGLTDAVVDAWKRQPAPGLKASEIGAVTDRERGLLRSLRDELTKKSFVWERYVRVACPARGTLLASGNFDVFLSALLSVVGTVSGLKASGIYTGFARILMEIVKRRMDPQAIPGIEAMLPDAPLPELLSRASRQRGVRMAVIAGDIEGGGFWQRVGVMFTDWTFFDQLDNDLVVDTGSMYEGLARDGGAHGLFDQGPRVNHFRYFENVRTREALAGWLTGDGADLAGFVEVPARDALARAEVAARATRAAGPKEPSGKRPVVVFLPGTMGSHLELLCGKETSGQGNRIWFDVGSLSVGGFAKLEWPSPSGESGKRIEAEALFEMFYGKLCDHLEKTHDVVRFAYDWRKPIQDEAERLARRVAELLALTAASGQPVQLLAHSMGGLVCRAMIAREPALWDKIVSHPAGRFVMLGTPNNGSHLLVQHLIGKAGTTRALAKIDLLHGLKKILDVAATMPGALQLLPRPGFVDTANEQAGDYFLRGLWEAYQKKSFDRWFGDGVCAVPASDVLASAREFWTRVLSTNEAPTPVVRVSYVFGSDPETPCGVREEKDDRDRDIVRPLMTAEGDGSVTWRSGRLDNLPESQLWWMEASHGDLTRKTEAFGAIVELLQSGTIQDSAALEVVRPGLPRLRSAGVARATPFEAGPPRPPTPEEAAAGFFGGHRPAASERRPPARRLKLSITAGDLRFVGHPVVCGHYRGDPIAGAESMLDEFVVNGGLRQRERLGFYPLEIGSSTVVLMAPSGSRRAASFDRGALVLGLGEYGKLSAPTLTETVRAGVLRFLIAVRERETGPEQPGARRELALAPLLIGYNSTTNITIDDSIGAMVRGVMLANREFLEAMGSEAHQVTALEFVELYLDTAISAAHALARLPLRLKREFEAERVTPVISRNLKTTVSARLRLSDAGGGAGYWPRMVVTDANQLAVECPPECFEVRRVSAMPSDACRELLRTQDCECLPTEVAGKAESRKGEAEKVPAAAAAATDAAKALETPAPRVAVQLRYLFLSERARAENVVNQRQPRLIEQLVASAVGSSRYEEELGRMFFQLMIPLDFKEAARHAQRLILVVDAATASFPWEMLVADDEPLVTRAMMVRQFSTTQFRTQVRGTTQLSALVIGNPSTEGFAKVFPLGDARSKQGLVDLSGASEEAEAVRDVLQASDWKVTAKIGTAADARAVMVALFRQPYRVIHIAAHGLFEATGRDGLRRTGVVLSDGLVLSAAEIRQMEVVPEVVFLNCCHLGRADSLPRSGGRLADSLARALIDMGVRCVVAAGWEVDDAAGELFATTFYRAMLEDGRSFGEAIFEARREVWQKMRHCNTWGAYQAYGDPAFKLRRDAGDGAAWGDWRWVSPLELEAQIHALTVNLGVSTRAADRQSLTLDPARKAKAEAGLASLLKSAPPDFLERAEVQAAVGRFYFEFGDFERALKFYEKAVGAEDLDGALLVKVVERLANLEARYGELVETSAPTGESTRETQPGRIEGRVRPKTAQEWLGQALGRLEGLLGISREASIAGRPPGRLESWAVYGSACKRMAGVLRREGKAASEIRWWLERARDAYAVAEQRPGSSDPRPYPALNRLQLDVLLGKAKGAAIATLRELAQRAGDAARVEFEESFDFFGAVGPIDAELTVALLDRAVAAKADALCRRYREAASEVPSSERQFDSVVRQLRLLADLGEVLDLPAAEVTGLRRIADSLGGTVPPPTAPPPKPAAPRRPAPRTAARPRRPKTK